MRIITLKRPSYRGWLISVSHQVDASFYRAKKDGETLVRYSLGDLKRMIDSREAA